VKFTFITTNFPTLIFFPKYPRQLRHTEVADRGFARLEAYRYRRQFCRDALRAIQFGEWGKRGEEVYMGKDGPVGCQIRVGEEAQEWIENRRRGWKMEDYFELMKMTYPQPLINLSVF
jgi:hypothetical protein